MRHLIICKSTLDSEAPVIRRIALEFLVVNEFFHEHSLFRDQHNKNYIEFILSREDSTKFYSLFNNLVKTVYDPKKTTEQDKKGIKVGSDILSYIGPYHIHSLLKFYELHELNNRISNPYHVKEMGLQPPSESKS
jgi:hypothetical protein